MKIFIGADHGGFTLKEIIKVFLEKAGHTVEDVGPFSLDPTDDYPDYAFPLAQKVARQKAKGILVCRNGIGVCIVANKVNGIRAVTTDEPGIAKTSRQDDDTNILCLGQDYMNSARAKQIVRVWLRTPFSNATRHRRRINKIKKIEHA